MNVVNSIAAANVITTRVTGLYITIEIVTMEIVTMEIIDGPFADFLGKIDSIDANSESTFLQG